jgi:hypothetical protein
MTGPISESTNLGVFPYTIETSSLGDDLEDTVIGDLEHSSSVCLEEDSPCEGQSQGWYYFAVTLFTIA